VLASTDVPAACRHLETALAAFAQAGIPYRTAQTRLLLAQLLGGNDREVTATEARTALSAFEDLGADHDADAAAALMRDLGVKAPRTGPKKVGRLTKREQEVLALLGERLSNPQIAERLFLSRKTVEHHVARILCRLGLRGRAEAAIAARSTPRYGPATTSLDLAGWLPDVSTLQRSAALSRAQATRPAGLLR
jgi:DNA-binding NarL/FixJ family response regulator